MGILPKVKATATQRRVLARYLENGGDKVEAYCHVWGEERASSWTKAQRQNKAHSYFKGATMKALMQEADIESRIQIEKRAITQLDNVINKYSITRERIMEELAKIAFANQTDVASWGPDGVVVKDSKDIGDAAAAVGEVSQSGGGEGAAPTIKVKLLDKQQALINLGRELGMFAQKVDVKGQVAVAAAAKFVIEK